MYNENLALDIKNLQKPSLTMIKIALLYNNASKTVEMLRSEEQSGLGLSP